MNSIKNWNGDDVEIAESRGRVRALINPFENMIGTKITPWPPVEIVQKIYQSGHLRDFNEEEQKRLCETLGYYTDLQSLHSEDAIVWSVFGTICRFSCEIQKKWISGFLKIMKLDKYDLDKPEIFLWRRFNHPETLGARGPEIDFGINAGKIVILGEAKWKSRIIRRQGKKRNLNQLQIREKWLDEIGSKVFPEAEKIIVVVGLEELENYYFENIGTYSQNCHFVSWEALCDLSSHPLFKEIQKYLKWKKDNSKLE